MTEFQIMTLFNGGLISNAIYVAGGFFLLWTAFRGAIIIYNEGAPVLTKVLSSIYSLGIVYVNLRNFAFLDINWQSAAYSLSQMDNLSDSGQRFVQFREDFFGIGEPQFSLIPTSDPIILVWWIAVVVMLMGQTWMKKPS